MKKRGFSLMEMMIVLLIVAIVIAASAPMINKKLVRSAANDSSPWVWTSALSNSIAYNLGGNDNASASIGTITPGAPGRLFIHTKGNIPQIAFGHGDYASMKLQVTGDSVSLTDKDTNNGGNFTVAMGYGAKADSTGSISVGFNSNTKGGAGAVAIGREAEAKGLTAIAVGVATANTDNSIAMGSNANAKAARSIALGATSTANGEDSVAIGTNTTTTTNAISIGRETSAANQCVAIGYNTTASPSGSYPQSVAIGYDTHANSSSSTAIGVNSSVGSGSSYSVAIGSDSDVSDNSFGIAIGHMAKVKHFDSIAIGSNIETTAAHQIKIACNPSYTNKQIILGDADTTVYIPGNLVVGKITYLGIDHTDTTKSTLWVNMKRHINNNLHSVWIERGSGGENDGNVKYADGGHGLSGYSDRRLKNVGEAFTSGLEAVKKLEVFNYTFKNDKSKTPRVGVMAQDLQKIFPNAVMKGEDGFLRIRMEDMFYAVINAIKELDEKVTSLIEQVKTFEELKKENLKQQKQIDMLEKRLTELEKKIK